MSEAGAPETSFVGSGLVLTEKQVAILAAHFDRAAGEHGDIEAQQVEQLAMQLFREHVTNEMLDVIIDLTDGHDVVSRDEFIDIMASVMDKTTFWGELTTPIAGAVGFDTLPQQLNAKALKRGFEFNLMVVGEAGLGKSTLIDTLFSSPVSRTTANPSEGAAALPSTLEVTTVTHVLDENGVRLKLSITDTPGFGVQINNTGSWSVIQQFVKRQFEEYLSDELSIDRPTHIPDHRIHCCLYFIAPTGHGLKPMDIEFMKQLQHSVNIVPVIAKADGLTADERKAFKERIREDLDTHAVSIYPRVREDDDAKEEAANVALRELLPFAVVGSRATVKDKTGKLVRGREGRAGNIEVDNPKHCEFSALRNMLLRTHLQDLKEVTSQLHYEAFRRQHLTAPTSS